jgi:cyclomaltodextrin glucanotransferase
LKRRVLYQLLTDRFAADGGRAIRGLSRTGPASRWVQYAGGTYDGIVHRLPYLQALGISAIWISPIPENSNIPSDGSRPYSEGYHGYWARDFERLNLRFGDEESLVNLLKRVQEYDIKVILDIVLNHSNPTYADDKGDLYRDGKLFARYSDDKRSAFHHFGDLDQRKAYEAFAWENHNVWGLADLAQENHDVSDYLKEAHARWLSLGFHGVRLDTTLHMPAKWIGEWVQHVKQRVPDCDFFFGEWWNGGPHDEVSSQASRTAGIHLTDFGFARTVRGWLSGRIDFEELVKCVDLQESFLDPDLKVNFIDNHDMPRLRNLLCRSGVSQSVADFRNTLANVLLLLWRGVPCVYYGTESGLYTERRARGKKTGDDPYNREPMRFLKRPTQLHEIIQELSRLRKETNLTDHRLEMVSLAPDKWRLSRGETSLTVVLETPGGIPVEAVLKVGQAIWWKDTGERMPRAHLGKENR